METHGWLVLELLQEFADPSACWTAPDPANSAVLWLRPCFVDPLCATVYPLLWFFCRMNTTSESLDIQRHLAVMPLFGDLSPEERARLSQGCQLKRFARGEMVFRIGDPCEAFFVVIVGQVKLFMLSPTGQEKVIEIVGPSQSFAEAMVFLDIPCMVSVQALADSLLLSVSQQGVFKEIEQDHRFSLRMLAGMSKRLHGLVHDVQAYALRSGMQRLIGYLLRDVEQNSQSNQGSVTISLPATKATIASRLSLTPEYLSRALRELESAGLIQVDKRKIHILDVAKLATYGSL
jgi:CRP-like cAMP-binding protein